MEEENSNVDSNLVTLPNKVSHREAFDALLSRRREKKKLNASPKEILGRMKRESWLCWKVQVTPKSKVQIRWTRYSKPYFVFPQARQRQKEGSVLQDSSHPGTDDKSRHGILYAFNICGKAVKFVHLIFLIILRCMGDGGLVIPSWKIRDTTKYAQM